MSWNLTRWERCSLTWRVENVLTWLNNKFSPAYSSVWSFHQTLSLALRRIKQAFQCLLILSLHCCSTSTSNSPRTACTLRCIWSPRWMFSLPCAVYVGVILPLFKPMARICLVKRRLHAACCHWWTTRMLPAQWYCTRCRDLENAHIKASLHPSRLFALPRTNAAACSVWKRFPLTDCGTHMHRLSSLHAELEGNLLVNNVGQAGS